jgi:hypothetical protein
MNIRLHGLVIVALGGIVATACASADADRPRPAPAGNDRAVVEVTNHNWLDVNIYAVRSGQRARLGTVGSMMTERFTIPDAMVNSGEVRLMAAPIGSPRVHRTDPILVLAGDVIRWNVENRLAHSSYSVRHAAPR